jgi:hypothetical protein
MTVVAAGSPSAFSSHFRITRIEGKKPLTRLAALATLSPRERAARAVGFQPSPLGRGWPATAFSPAVDGRVRGHFQEDGTQNYLRNGMYAGTRRW